jgi:hypothetical protein
MPRTQTLASRARRERAVFDAVAVSLTAWRGKRLTVERAATTMTNQTDAGRCSPGRALSQRNWSPWLVGHD